MYKKKNKYYYEETDLEEKPSIEEFSRCSANITALGRVENKAGYCKLPKGHEGDHEWQY